MTDTIKKRGWARMHEIRAEDEAKRQQLVAELVAGLGRHASALDRITIETLATTCIRADRLRSSGRADFAERKLILQLQRGLGLKPAAPAAPRAETMDEYLARTAAEARA
jgi:hypothetical protein